MMTYLICWNCGLRLAAESVRAGMRFCHVCQTVDLAAVQLTLRCRLCGCPLAPINALARVKECFACTSLISALNWSLYWQGVEREAVKRLRELRDESEGSRI